jgi:hypothetical protein
MTALSGPGLLLFLEASRSHSDTPHSVWLLWRVISPTQRTPPDKSQYSKQTSTPLTRFDPQSQQQIGRKPKPYTVRLLGSDTAAGYWIITWVTLRQSTSSRPILKNALLYYPGISTYITMRIALNKIKLDLANFFPKIIMWPSWFG